jgi:hypothetical protein
MAERIVKPSLVISALGVALGIAPHTALARRSQPVEARRSDSDATSAVPAPHVRVLVERASIYSGPGFAFRVIATVERDEVMPMVERGKRGGWTRVRLDSGITGWVLAEQIHVFGVEPAAGARVGPFRRLGRKLRDKVLGPPNLLTARIGGTLSAGALGSEGLFLVRPSAFIAPHFALEGYVGPSAGRETTRGLMGLGGNLYISPHLPVTLFLSVGTGAAYTKGKVDRVAEASWSYLLSPGGGFWIIFKHNVGLRFDVRNHLLFRSGTSTSLQEYSGALAFTF